MNATTTEARMAVMAQEEKASTSAVHYAQNAMLSELPGVVFALLTLGYVVSSLVALI
ncbi:MAG TPA: hypothetical protein VIX59_11280 [Candidatus Binataceae bacterium]